MTAMAKMQAAEALEGASALRKYYLEALNLVEMLHRQFLAVIKDDLDRSEADRRSVLVRLTPKDEAVRDMLTGLFERHLGSLEAVSNVGGADLDGLNVTLKRMERFWIDQVRFRL